MSQVRHLQWRQDMRTHRQADDALTGHLQTPGDLRWLKNGHGMHFFGKGAPGCDGCVSFRRFWLHTGCTWNSHESLKQSLYPADKACQQDYHPLAKREGQEFHSSCVHVQRCRILPTSQEHLFITKIHTLHLAIAFPCLCSYSS